MSEERKIKFDVDDLLGYLFNCAAILIRKRVEASLKKEGIELGVEEFGMLARIYCISPISQSAIVNSMGKDRALITRILNKIEQKGFVKRVSDKNDKRNNIIELTDEGHKIADLCVPAVLNMHHEIESKINSEDLQIMKKTLRTIINNLQEELF